MKKTLNLIGPINYLGYGIVFKHLAIEIIKQGHQYDVSVLCKSNPQISQEDMSDELGHGIQRGYMAKHSSDYALHVWHLHDMSQFAGKVRIGYPIFEMPKFNAREIHNCNELDYIWVPSHWAQEIVQKHTDTPCDVVPCGVDTKVFNPGPSQPFMRDDNFFTFLALGKLEKRKGHMLMLDVLDMIAGDTSKPVRLILYCHNPFIQDIGKVIQQELSTRNFLLSDNDRQDNYVRFRHSSAPEECVIDVLTVTHIPTNTMPALYKSADVGLFPFFAEGWNLPLVEAMACGLPCIANNYSGPSEYLNDNNHITLNTTREMIAIDNKFFNGSSGTWRVPTNTCLAEAVHSMIDMDDADRKKIGDQAAEDMSNNFTWDKAAKKAITLLQEMDVA